MSNKKNRLKDSTAITDAPAAAPAAKLILPDIKQAGEAEPIEAKPNGNGAVHRAAEPIVTDVQANCGNCLCFVTKDGISGECRGGPPTAQLLGFAEHPITRQPVPRVQGYFAPVHKDIWCGRWNGPGRHVDGKTLIPFIAFKEVGLE